MHAAHIRVRAFQYNLSQSLVFAAYPASMSWQLAIEGRMRGGHCGHRRKSIPAPCVLRMPWGGSVFCSGAFAVAELEICK